ncbi:MAG: DUF4097 family beta strand repeat-containing protein [Longimicrobiaceae bacterium]
MTAGSVRYTVATLCTAVLALGSGESLAAQQTERHTLRGNAVAISNLVGEMRVEAGAGSDVLVEVTRAGRDAGRLRTQTGSMDGRETLSVVYPGDQIIYPRMGRSSRSQLRLRDDGTFGGSERGGRQVTVSGGGSGIEAYADLRVSVPAGRRIVVHQGVGKVWVSNVDGELRVDASSASIESEGTRGTLTIDVGSGSVQVRGAEGDVTVDSGSGSVQASQIRGSRLRLDTGSGSVTATDLTVDDLNVDVGSGRVRLSGVRARNAVVDTGSGGVEIALTAPIRSLRIETGSGGVNLTVPENIGADVEIDTGSGGITVDLPAEITRRSRNYFRGRIGDGSGSIRIDTGSGGVRVRRG